MIELVVDVSLSPAWVDVFVKHGWPAVHWSSVGDPRAKDRTVMAWAREHVHVVFTHDLADRCSKPFIAGFRESL